MGEVINKKTNLVLITLLLAASFIFGLSACYKNESGGAIIDEEVTYAFFNYKGYNYYLSLEETSGEQYILSLIETLFN